jgi:GNAT superfamily N-acetyltransferase
MKIDENAGSASPLIVTVARGHDHGILDAAPGDVSAIASLLRDWPLHPYAAYASEINENAYAAFRDWRVRRILDQPHSRTLVARSVGAIVATGCWSFLPWDTQVLGWPSARLEWLAAAGSDAAARGQKDQLVRGALEQCRGDRIRYLTARLHSADLPGIHALEENGFELIDGIQTFSLRLDSAAPAMDPAWRVRLYEPQDFQQILAIARASYVFDRFHADAHIPREIADSVNQRWVENCCLGTMADAVLVALDGETPVGYVTCKVDHEAAGWLRLLFGTIGMVATDPTWRGRGIARAATYAALDWFAQQGVKVVEVGTQLSNIPAGRLYEQCGFRLMATTLTFRKLL